MALEKIEQYENTVKYVLDNFDQAVTDNLSLVEHI